MKKLMKKMKAAAAVFLAVALSLQASACAMKVNATDLMKGITSESGETVAGEVESEHAARAADLAARLLRQCFKEKENLSLSPASILYALAMTMNGAKGDTLQEMESTLGLTAGECNEFLKNYRTRLQGTEFSELHLANSIWFKDDPAFTVDPAFLQTNADYYRADAYQLAFDSRAADSINAWVKENTAGMIPEILEKIPKDAIMYLVNALSFEAEWQKKYEKKDVSESDFTTASGTVKKVDMMFSDEHSYLETNLATGFVKYYKGGDYAFAALLPKEGVALRGVVDSLNGTALRDLLREPAAAPVNAGLPKFKAEYSTELSEVLQEIGMRLPFDPGNADFSGLGIYQNANISISAVLHKTFIEVAEKGTRAGAATVVEMVKSAAFIDPEERKTVILDRPFLYMLYDTATGIPFFIGAMNEI